jgi:predicted aspartyl protease
MSSRIIYPLQRSGNLLFLRASVGGLQGDPVRLRLLVDTGSSYTTLPLKVLADLGYVVDEQNRRVAIMTAGGMGRAPLVSVASFNCLGESIENFPVVGLDLPFNPLMSGLLGMDFLSRFNLVIDVRRAEIVMNG